MVLLRALLPLLAATVLCAQTPLFPLKDLRPGMRATGKTVFQGDKIEDFSVEILGVLENMGPRQSLILGKLSGGPLEKTGVMQGMSGSPVYLDGKLVGAVAMAFPFAKEAIAGIRPIEEMVGSPIDAPTPKVAKISPWTQPLADAFPKRREAVFGPGKLADIATPVSFSGFTQRTLEVFGPQLRAIGLEPVQGVSAGGSTSTRMGNPSALKPGSMISVQLVSGDLVVGADGTVTHIDGRTLYAFGHRFLAAGPTELPFARAEVITPLANTQQSFKISTAKEMLGAITADQNTVVKGELGRRPVLAPVTVTVRSRGAGTNATPSEYQYKFEMVRDKLLTPFLLQMSVFSVLDATERMLGTSSVRMSGSIELENSAPLKLENMFSGDFNVPLLASVAASAPLAYALQSNFDTLKVKSIHLDLDTFEVKKVLQVDRLWTSKREIKPGESVELSAALVGPGGAEVVRKFNYTVPVGAQTGTLYFTVADGNSLNLEEYRKLLNTPPRTATQLVGTLNALRGNTRMFLRVWRAEPDYTVQGDNLPDPPPSLAMILQKTQPLNTIPSQNSKVDEVSWDMGDMVITGAKTAQVEVKE